MFYVMRNVARVREIGDMEADVGARSGEGGDRPSVRQDDDAAGEDRGRKSLAMGVCNEDAEGKHCVDEMGRAGEGAMSGIDAMGKSDMVEPRAMEATFDVGDVREGMNELRFGVKGIIGCAVLSLSRGTPSSLEEPGAAEGDT